MLYKFDLKDIENPIYEATEEMGKEIDQLVSVRSGYAVTSSRVVANVFNRAHRSILRDIRNLIKSIGDTQNWTHLFCSNEYKHPQNKQIYEEYIITTKGLRLFIDNKRKTKSLKPVINLYNYMQKLDGEKVQPIILTDRFEDSFFSDLREVLDVLGIDLRLQYPVLNYRVDGYLPEYNIVIEYDEEQHYYNQEEDKEREREIKGEMNCSFIRLDYQDTNATNIGVVIKELQEVCCVWKS